MANTQDTFNGNGSNLGPFSFNFPWLESTDIKVSVDGVLKTAGTHYNLQALNYSSKNGGEVLFTAGNAPGIGTGNIRVYRDTDDEELSATFYPGSAIRAQDLNDNFTQNLYVTQEINNYSLLKDGSEAMEGDLDMGNYRITNLATPTTNDNAVNKLYVDSRLGSLDVPGFTRWSKTAVGGETTLSGAGTTGGTLGYSPNREQVYLNGAQLQRDADYTANNGTSIVLNVALIAGDVVEVICVNNLNTGTTAQAQDVYWNQSGSGAVTRTVESKLRDVVSVKDFDTVASAAATGNHIYFPSGTYDVPANVTFTGPVQFDKGAILKPANGVTITLNGSIIADRYKIFDTSLGGSIATGRTNSIGYPEWFGAVIDSSPSATTNLSAIENTLAIFGECNLAGGDYFISDTLEITQSFRRIQGQFNGIGSNTQNGQTRLVVTSATADTVHVFTTGLPTDKSTWISNVQIKDVQLARNTPPQMSATAKGSCAGLRAECVSWLRSERVFCGNHIIGVYLAKTIRTYLISTHVLRVSSAASHPIDNGCYGFWIDGSSRISGFVSGNASCYMQDCSLTIESGLDVLDDTLSTTSIGLYAEDTASDLFVEDFEVARCKTGISFNMVNVTDPDTKLKGLQDVHIRNFILDVITKYGVVIQNLTSPAHIVRLDGGYINVDTNAAGADPIGIYELATYGQVTVTNTQIIGRCTGSTGIYVSSGRNGFYRDCTILDCQKPFVQLGGRHVTFDSSVINTSLHPTTQAAVQVTNGSRCVYRPTIDGDSAAVAKGVEFLGSPQNLVEVDTTNIVSTAIAGGTSNILLWKGSAITTNNSGVNTSGSDKLLHIGFVA